MMHRISKLAILFFLSTGLYSQSAGDMAGFFPAIEGWKAKEKPLFFYPENLYEYIDGAAENFLSYEFQVLAVQTYENSEKKSMTMEIYRHSNARNAFGIYSSEKPLAGDYLAVGGEGYQEQGMLNFCCGVYYVKINAYDLDRKEQGMLPERARMLAAKLGREPGLPSELAFFPPAGKTAHSERFILKNFLGHPFLGSAFRADYEKGGAGYQVFLIAAGGREEAGAMLKKWLELAEKKPVPQVQEKLYEIGDPYNGKILAEWKGSHLWGAVKCPETEAAGLMSELKKNAENLVK